MYPKKAQNVAKVLRDLYEEFRALKKIPKPRQTEAWVQDKVEPWLGSLNVGLDIRTTDVGFRSRQEELFGVKETDVEEAFWNDQINGKRVGFCETFVDKKWLATDARRKRDLEGWKKRLERSEKDKKVLEEKINQNVERAENGKFKCTLCGKEAKQKIQIQYHIEGVHMEGLSLPCNICGRTFSSRNAFTVHKFREHKV